MSSRRERRAKERLEFEQEEELRLLEWPEWAEKTRPGDPGYLDDLSTVHAPTVLSGSRQPTEEDIAAFKEGVLASRREAEPYRLAKGTPEHLNDQARQIHDERGEQNGQDR